MRVIPYRKVPELSALSKIFMDADGNFQNGVRFIVPSRRDRDWWRVRAGFPEYGLEPENLSHTRQNLDTRLYLWNWEDLYGDICAFFNTPPLRQIDPPDHRLILSRVVRKFLEEDPSGPGLLEAWPGLARPGFIEILSGDIRELINEAVSPSQLGAAEREGDPTSRVLPLLYVRYLEYLREYGLMDSAQIPLVSSELLKEDAKPWAKDKNFVFAGFMSFTHGQLELIHKLEALSLAGVVVLKPETELKNFQDATRQLEDKTWEDAPPFTNGFVASLRSSEPGLEPEMLARCLALWNAGKGVFAERYGAFPGFGATGVSVHERGLPAMEAALRRYRVPYSLALGRSVSEGAAGTVLTPLWAAWLQGLESYETALLLAQPCFAGADFSIDDAVRAGPRGVKAWESYLAGLPGSRPAKAFRAMVRFCGAVEKGARPAGLFKAFHDFLSAPGLWLDALADFSVASPELDDSLRELSAAVTEVLAKHLALRELQPDIGAAGKIIMKGKEAMDFLKNWCEETRIQPSPPLAGAVALYAGYPPILASYPVWIMTGVTQKNWPGVIRSSPLLDAPERDAIRSASGYLPSSGDKRAQKEALFRRLLQTGDELTVIVSSNVDDEGRPAGTTPFIAPFIEDMKNWEYYEAPAAGPADLAPEAGPWSFPAIEEAAFRERAVPVATFAEAAKAAQAGKSLSEAPRVQISGLYELLDCPFRYWLKYKVRLKERETALFSAADAGTVTHKIWEAVWSRWREAGDARADLRALAAEEWEKARASGRLGRDRRLLRYAKNIEFYVMRLAGLQRDILNRLADAGLRHAEISTETELAPFSADGVVFTGRCDRVEVFDFFDYPGTAEKLAVITDYKLGRAASYEKKLPGIPRGQNFPDIDRESFRFGLQLSAYALMYAAGRPGLRVAGVAFLGHRDGELAGSFEPPLAGCYLPGKKNAALMEERTAEALDAMKLAAAIVKSGRYEPSYSADACRYCDVKGVCRKQGA